MPPLPRSNAQGADTTRPMTDATDAVDTITTSVLLVPFTPHHVVRSGTTQAEVSPPNSLCSLCGGNKQRRTGQALKNKKLLDTDTVHSPRDGTKFQLITKQIALFLAINLPTEARTNTTIGGLA